MSERRAPRTAVDTNLFVSGTIVTRGNPFALLEAWRGHSFVPILSDEQHAELIDVFRRSRIVRRYGLPTKEIASLFAGLATTPRVEPSPTIPVPLRDPKDPQILAAALGGDADYLVTGDNDPLEHRGNPRLGKLKIETVAEFLAVLDHLDVEEGGAP